MLGAHGCKKELSVFLVLERTDVVNPMRVLAIQPGSSDKAVNACNHRTFVPVLKKALSKVFLLACGKLASYYID